MVTGVLRLDQAALREPESASGHVCVNASCCFVIDIASLAVPARSR
jgi:hypothetical protein